MANSLQQQEQQQEQHHGIEPQPVVAAAADAGVFEKAAVELAQTEELPATGQDDSNAPPDGGLQAWLQVVASFALYFNHL